MIHVMFVCHGNICRSPMAEFILKHLVKKEGLEKDFVIESCATSTEEIWNGIGNCIYPPAQTELKKNNIPFDHNKRAVQIRKSDYEKYDYFLCMDTNNIRNALWILGDDPQNKLKLLMSYTGHPRNVSDPWYSRNFTTAFNDIYEGCECFLNKITAK